MAKDIAMATKIEDYIVTALLAAKDTDNNCPFDTVAVYTDQLAPENGGIKAADKYRCFAFVGFAPADAEREGDFDLDQILKISVLVGATYDIAGLARRGDNLRYGTNKLREFVIATLDKQHPTYGSTNLTCDDIIFRGENLLCETSRTSILEMSFDVPYIM